MINHFRYSNLVGMKTIECLFEDESIDTVYVRYCVNDDDRMFDGHETYDMIALERIMNMSMMIILK